jgi:uncharacterized protein (UPF0297 family)
MMGPIKHTQFFKRPDKEPENQAKKVLNQVYEALSEKGYNPTYQLVGYIMSGDPTYITSHKEARKRINQLERDELLEELVTDYIKHNFRK